MRKQLPVTLEKYRYRDGPMASDPGMHHGAFLIPFESRELRVVSSGYDHSNDWEHVSVSLPSRCPNWREMNYIKDVFWDAEEVVIQFHPKRSEYINNMPYCLHLWKHKTKEIETPPGALVGIKDLQQTEKETSDEKEKTGT